MSAVSIHTPVIELPRRSATVIAFPAGRRGAAPVVQDVERPVATPLRLTRRGRLVVTMLVAAVLAAVGLLGARTALAGEDAASASMRQVTVAPGDTLWSIAAESVAAEGGRGDVRERVAEIADLNALESSSIVVGQELVVPAP